MRVWIIAILTLTAAGVAGAQTRDEQWQRCSGTNPDLSIGACTALIQSGQESNTNLSIAFHNRGLAYYNKNDYDRALQDYNQSLSLNSNYASAYNNRGNVYWMKGQKDLALLDYEQTLKLDPKVVQAYYNRGMIYDDKGDYDRAIKDYDEAIRLDPLYANAYNERGYSYSNKGQYDSALQDHNEAIRLDSTIARAYRYRSFAYRKLGEYSRAIADINRALSIDSDSLYAISARARIYEAQGDYISTVREYDERIRLKPGDADAYNYRCWARAIGGLQLQKALADCNESLKLRSGDASTLDSRGLVHLKLKMYAAAIKDYNAALALDATLAYSFFGRGVAKRIRGDISGGDADIATAKALSSAVAEQMAKYGIKP